MKVIELVDLIQDYFANDIIGDQKAVYSPNVIIGHLRNVFNQIVYETWEKGKRESDFSQLDAWTRTYPVTITDTADGKAYCFLPFTPVQLPDGVGIREVHDHDDEANVFAPIESGANVVFAELEVDAMDFVPTYRLEQNNMFEGDGEPSHILKLERLPVPASITQVDVVMIVNMEQLGDYDDVAIPSGMEDNIIQRVIDVMSHKPPQQDTLNDEEPSQNIL
jgi:hypothetical protein